MHDDSPLHAEPERTPRTQDAAAPRPYWLVALIMLAGLAALFAGAILLDRQFRPPVGMATVPGVAGATTPTMIPATSPATPSISPSPTASPTLPAIPTTLVASPSPPVTVTVPPPVTPLPPDQATAVAMGVVLTQTPVIQPGTTSNPQELERTILAAYIHYWEVRQQAYLDLDTSHLSEVMAGAELDREIKQIRDLKAKGWGMKIDVEHHVSFALLADDHATIYDPYLNRTLYIDATTKQEYPTGDPPTIEKVSFVLKKIDGIWKVIDGARLP